MLIKILEENEKEIKEAIKKEYPLGQSYYFDYRDQFPEEFLENALNYRENDESLDSALERIIEEERWEEREEFVENVEKVIVEWLNENKNMNLNFETLEEELTQEEREELNEFAMENTEYDIDIDTFKKNTVFEEITVHILPNKYYEDDYNKMNKYQAFDYYEESKICPDSITVEGVEEVKEDLTDIENPDMINWLVQTQGYELSDLYDFEKVENSKFLKSLKEELTDYTTVLEGGLSVTAIGGDFESFEAIVGNKNLVIKPDTKAYIGISGWGTASGLNIQLEKELVIPREWVHAEYYIDTPSSYSVQGTCGLIRSDENVFRETSNKAIEYKPADIEKLLKTVQKREEKLQEAFHIAEKLEKNTGLPVLVSTSSGPFILIEKTEKMEIQKKIELLNEIRGNGINHIIIGNKNDGRLFFSPNEIEYNKKNKINSEEFGELTNLSFKEKQKIEVLNDGKTDLIIDKGNLIYGKKPLENDMDKKNIPTKTR